MNALALALDELVAVIAAATGERCTRDPQLVHPPCIFIDAPEVTARTMGATTIEVPVHVVAGAPSSVPGLDWMLATTPTVLDAVQASQASPRALPLGDATYPAMTVAAVVTIARS